MIKVPRFITSTPPLAQAGIGLLFAVPFLIINALVGNQFQPFVSWIRPDGHTSLVEIALLWSLLLLFLVGAYIAYRPVPFGCTKDDHKLYLNIAAAVLLGAAFIGLTISLGMELYDCEILKTANCD